MKGNGCLQSFTIIVDAHFMDVVQAIRYIHRSHHVKYHKDMVHLAKLYMSTTARLCMVCSISETFQNTPNTLIFSYQVQTSMPLYSYALLIAEMGFEGNYQPLKDVLTKHSDTDAHISTFHNARFRVWTWCVSDT